MNSFYSNTHDKELVDVSVENDTSPYSLHGNVTGNVRTDFVAVQSGQNLAILRLLGY